MKIHNKSSTDSILKLEVNSNEESLFSLIKVYLQEMPEVDIVGFTKDHHLVDKTEFYLKVTKGKPEEVFKKGLEKAKKELEAMKQK